MCVVGHEKVFFNECQILFLFFVSFLFLNIIDYDVWICDIFVLREIRQKMKTRSFSISIETRLEIYMEVMLVHS